MAWDQLMAFLKQLEPLLYIVIPFIVGVYIKLSSKVKEQKETVLKANTAKNRQTYIDWEHQESLKIITRIRDLCNFYKDRGHMDLVNYIQLENGTLATSKICNMFLSCLAEDTRFGDVPKMISRIQRIPYSRLSCWVDKIMDDPNGTYLESDTNDVDDCCFRDIMGTDGVRSIVSCAIHDPNGAFIGVCSFFYGGPEWDGRTEIECRDLMVKFVSAVEGLFLDYHISRRKRRKELNLSEGD